MVALKKEETVKQLVEPLLGQLVQRGTNTVPAHALTTLAEAAYEKGAAAQADSVFGDVNRAHVCAIISREILDEVNAQAARQGMTAPVVGANTPFHFALYRLLGDVYSAAKGTPEGAQRDVRERAESFVGSFRTSLDGTEDGLQRAFKFLRELFVNALLEARETQHIVDWANPEQVELYTIAVEAESKRYEEINLKIAAAEKAERNPFEHSELKDIAVWFDERGSALDDGNPNTRLMQNDPIFAAALNRAFALGVLSASKAPDARFACCGGGAEGHHRPGCAAPGNTPGPA